jgi:hypothetical protein
MLYATIKSLQFNVSGHVGCSDLKGTLKSEYKEVEEIYADGDELNHCCLILDRKHPPTRGYTFIGENAKEIARNWY